MIDYESIRPLIKPIRGYLVPGQEKALFKLAGSVTGLLVEIGCFCGRSTCSMGLAIKDNPDCKLVSIDTFEGNDPARKPSEAEFHENIRRCGLQSVVTLIKDDSKKIGKQWHQPIDLLFVDALHTYEGAKSDVDLFFPWLRVGGLLVLHDVACGFSGVDRVWNEIKDRLSGIGNETTLYWGTKR